MGSTEAFEVYTDHKNLEYFRKPQRLNPRQARWVTALQNYDFKLIHISGKSNFIANAMS